MILRDVKVVDLMEYDGSDEIMANMEFGNDMAKMYYIGSSYGNARLDKWLITLGFKENDRVLLWVSW